MSSTGDHCQKKGRTLAKRNEEVFEAVKKLVKRKPDAKVDDAVKVAQKIDSSIDPDDKRSFNARYLLPAKRTVGGGKKKASKKKKASRKKTSKKKAAGRKKSAEISTKARNLMMDREEQILQFASNNDMAAIYRLKDGVDDFLKKLQKAL